MTARATPSKINISVDLSRDAFDVLESLREDMSQSAFLDLVLRMLDSRAVRQAPKNLPAAQPKN